MKREAGVLQAIELWKEIDPEQRLKERVIKDMWEIDVRKSSLQFPNSTILSEVCDMPSRFRLPQSHALGWNPLACFDKLLQTAIHEYLLDFFCGC